MAIKNLLREEPGAFDVTGFDARDDVGGLWQCKEDEFLSAHEATIYNSSRFRCAISDFPLDTDTDVFPTATQLSRYFSRYAEHFDLKPHIRFNSLVTRVSRRGNDWIVEIQNRSAVSSTETFAFDKVLVANGTFVRPVRPKIEGIDAFEGKVLHTTDFKDPGQFRNKNVLVIGIGASAADIVCLLAQHGAKQTYLTYRHGTHLISRYRPDGRTSDHIRTLNFSFILAFLDTWFPRFKDWAFDKALARISAKAFDAPEVAVLSPAVSWAVTTPLPADELYPRLISGFAKLKSPVQDIVGPRAVRFEDDTILDAIDAIIFATGSTPDVSFLDEPHNPYSDYKSPAKLYRGIFPLHEDETIRNSLAFLGHGAIGFPGFAIHEAAGLVIQHVWLGKSNLPSHVEMLKYYSDWLKWRKILEIRHDGYAPKPFFQPWANHFRWLDEQAGLGFYKNFGWSIQAWKFWFQDRELYRLCLSGLFTPTIWRLFDQGKRKALPYYEARARIIHENQIANDTAKARIAMLSAKAKLHRD